MQTKAESLLDRRGLSLLEALIAGAVMLIGALAFMSMQSYQLKTNQNIQTIISRNVIQLQIERYLSDPNALAKTVGDTNPSDTGNAALANCYSSAAGNCVQTASQGFYLFSTANIKIAGITGQPVRYDYNGIPCSTASSTCIFEVYTSYSATCPVASPCSNPSPFTATYTIQQAPGITPAGGTPLKTLTNTIPFPPVSSPPSSGAAWVTFATDGTILHSNNVSSVTYSFVNPREIYTVNFATAFPNSNYSTYVGTTPLSSGIGTVGNVWSQSPGSVQVASWNAAIAWCSEDLVTGAPSTVNCPTQFSVIVHY